MIALNDHDALVLLRLMGSRGVGARTLERVIGNSERVGVGLRDWIEQEGGGVLPTSVDRRELVATTNDADDRYVQQLAFLHREEVRILVRGQTAYPTGWISVLGKKAPPVLFGWGNLSLLQTDGVGFCGSRDASKLGLDAAAECAAQLARRGINVISGYARGVDLAAHRAALESGGTTTIVLAEGILSFRAKRDLRDVITASNSIVVSQFPPGLPWAIHNAMERNATICGASRALVVVDAGDTGGTLAAGRTALALGTPVFVVEHPPLTTGSRWLLSEGARALRAPAGEPQNLHELVEAMSERRANPSDETPMLFEEDRDDQ